MEKQEILQLIKKRRKGLKLTQKQMAEKLDIDQTQYSKYEIGASEISLSKLLKIGEILGLEIDVDIKDKTEAREAMKAELIQQFINFFKQKSWKSK